MNAIPVQIFKMTIAAFICGAAIGVFYDFLRITRVFLGYHYISEKSIVLQSRFVKRFSVKNNQEVRKHFYFKAILFFEDIIFLTVSAVIFVLLLFYGNDGIFRSAAFIAFILGFVVYYFTLGKINVLLFDALVMLFRTLIYYILYYIFLPIKYAVKKIIALSEKIFCILIKNIENIKIKRYNKKEIKDSVSSSEKGMLGSLR